MWTKLSLAAAWWGCAYAILSPEQCEWIANSHLDSVESTASTFCGCTVAPYHNQLAFRYTPPGQSDCKTDVSSVAQRCGGQRRLSPGIAYAENPFERVRLVGGVSACAARCELTPACRHFSHSVDAVGGIQLGNLSLGDDGETLFGGLLLNRTQLVNNDVYSPGNVGKLVPTDRDISAGSSFWL